MNLWKRLLALLLAICLLCASCAGNGTEATTMSLMKTEGSVTVEDAEGKEITPSAGMKLYSGYGMETETASYAWIDLDSVKLVKMDQDSKVRIQKEGKNLALSVVSGSLFFHVSEPLADNETMDIRTSTMVVGIRGTCGWVSAEDASRSQVYILEGTVAITVSGSGEEVLVHAGEMADVTVDQDGETSVTVSAFRTSEIPAFVQAELEGDTELAAEIMDASGLDVLSPPEETVSNDAANSAYGAVLAEYRDAKENALPYDEYDPELEGNYEINRGNYPLLGPCWYYMGPEYPLYYAYYDLDSNGVDELIVAAEWNAGSLTLLEIYAFDGTTAVPLSSSESGRFFWVYFSEVTADGLLIDVGNGGTTSNKEYRLAGDGYSLERVENSGVPGGVFIDDVDLAPYGGRLMERLDWTPLGDAPDGPGETGGTAFEDYEGIYLCEATNVTMVLAIRPDGAPIIYAEKDYVSDPDHVMPPANAYTLIETGSNGSIQVRQVSGEVIFSVLVMSDGLTVRTTGENDDVDYLSGNYRRQ